MKVIGEFYLPDKFNCFRTFVYQSFWKCMYIEIHLQKILINKCSMNDYFAAHQRPAGNARYLWLCRCQLCNGDLCVKCLWQQQRNPSLMIGFGRRIEPEPKSSFQPGRSEQGQLTPPKHRRVFSTKGSASTLLRISEMCPH